MFQDSKSGQTHFENDGCGEPAHNTPEKWEKEFHHLFEILTDSGKNLVNGRDDFEYWSFHDSLKSFIRQAISEAVKEAGKKSEDIGYEIALETLRAHIQKQIYQPAIYTESLMRYLDEAIQERKK